MNEELLNKNDIKLNSSIENFNELPEKKQKIVQEIIELIISEQCFNDEDKKTMLWAIPHLIKNTDKSLLAASRYKRLVMKCYTTIVPKMKKLFMEISENKFEKILKL